MYTYSSLTGTFGKNDLKLIGSGFDVVDGSIELETDRVAFVVIDFCAGVEDPKHYGRMRITVNPLRRAYIEPLLCTSLAHCERIFTAAKIVCDRLNLELCDSEQEARTGKPEWTA